LKTNDYEALIEDEHARADVTAQRRDAARLAEIANNLESLSKLVEAQAEAEAKECADGRDMTTEAVPAGGTPGGTPQ
jgi:hypothetical protein